MLFETYRLTFLFEHFNIVSRNRLVDDVRDILFGEQFYRSVYCASVRAEHLRRVKKMVFAITGIAAFLSSVTPAKAT